MTYGNKRDYPKIDIYDKDSNGQAVYIASTTWAKTCKEAVERYNANPDKKLLATHAHFDKEG